MKSAIVSLVSFLLLTAAAAPRCKYMPGDSEWPNAALWTNALPGVTARGPQDNTTGPTRPDYQLTVTTVSQVQVAIKFAAEKNIRLTILNGGLDFLGRNDAPSGLSLMVGNLKGVRVVEEFAASIEGVPALNYTSDPIAGVNVVNPTRGKQAAVTFGVGVTGQQLNDALAKSGLFTMAAMASLVKVAGGYSQTAGHGPFTSKYGLAADNILEYKVVTADGNLHVANAVSEPDLFWALRGGGGGTFGVVVEATMKAFPSPKMTMTRWWLKTINLNDTTSIYAPAAYALSQMPLVNQRDGVQGYFYIYPNEIWVLMFNADEQSGIPAANETWAPILSKLESFPGVKKPIYMHNDFPSFKVMFDSLFGALEVPGLPKSAPPSRIDIETSILRFRRSVNELEEAYARGIIPMDSRLLGQSHLSSPQLADSLQDSMPKMDNAMLRGHLTGGGQVLKLGEDTSVNPAWRKAYIHLIGTGNGVPNVAALKRLAPDMGCYSNECSYKETSFKQTMWGSNYARLYSIKQKYDPNGLFWVSPGIGADDFYTELQTGRVCRKDIGFIDTTEAYPPPIYDNQNMGGHEVGTYDLGPESQEAADREAAEAASKLAEAMAKATGKGTANPKTTIASSSTTTSAEAAPKSSVSATLSSPTIKTTLVPTLSSSSALSSTTSSVPKKKRKGKGLPTAKGKGVPPM